MPFLLFLILSLSITLKDLHTLENINKPLEASFPQMFDHIIPLGDNCQLNRQLAYLGLREANVGLEWLISESASSVASLILNEWEGFLDHNNFVLVRNDLITFEKYTCMNYVLDCRYNLKIVHEFPLIPQFLDWFDAFSAKYKKFINRFNDKLKTAESEGKSVLFIRRCASKEDAQLIADAIAKHYPNLNFTLFIIDKTEEVKKEWNLPRIVNRYLSQAQGYKATPQNIVPWRAVLGSIIDLTKMGKTIGYDQLKRTLEKEINVNLAGINPYVKKLKPETL